MTLLVHSYFSFALVKLGMTRLWGPPSELTNFNYKVLPKSSQRLFCHPEYCPDKSSDVTKTFPNQLLYITSMEYLWKAMNRTDIYEL